MERRVIYRWSCPYCGVSRKSRGSDDGEVRNRARSALRGHVYASDGQRHGPKNTTPSDFRDLEEHLELTTPE